MKNKKTSALQAVIAAIIVLLVLIPSVIIGAVAADPTVEYVNNTFDSFAANASLKKDNVNFFYDMPSTAIAKEYVSGNKAIEVKLAPGETSADKIAAEIKGGGLNIDKNIILGNKEIHLECILLIIEDIAKLGFVAAK